MVKILILGAVISGIAFSAAAQDASTSGGPIVKELTPEDSTHNGGAGIRAGNIAPTGRTLPNPGVSQGAGTTAMDRGIQEEDNRISNSICKGC